MDEFILKYRTEHRKKRKNHNKTRLNTKSKNQVFDHAFNYEKLKNKSGVDLETKPFSAYFKIKK